MANKSHFNSGLKALNKQNKDGKKHSSAIDDIDITKTIQAFFIEDAIQFLKKVPDKLYSTDINRPSLQFGFGHF